MNTARELTARLADLLRHEHAAMADFLVALAEFDRRRVWISLGYSSLFHFLHRELGLSKGAAHFRKTAAELLQRFPEVEAPLRDGRLCISSVVELAKVITPESCEEVLPRFFHRSKQEAKAVAAELCPSLAPPRRDVVTAFRREVAVHRADLGSGAPAEACGRAGDRELDETGSHSVHPDELDGTRSQSRDHHELRGAAHQPSAPPPASAAPAAQGSAVPGTLPTSRDTSDPLTADLSRLHVTVSRRFLAKLEAARDALSHSHPGASMEQILEAGLDLVLERHQKRKGLVAKPRKEPPPSSADYIPAHVRRAVWVRDGGRCQHPLESGGVCGSTWRLEFDHVWPRALGGPSTVENIRLACSFHNQLAARRAFGDELMDRYTRRRGPVEGTAPAPA